MHAYNWPGNVRELENALERSLLLSNDGNILEIAVPIITTKDESDASGYINLKQKLRTEKKQATNAIELSILEKALLEFDDNVSKVARNIGISTRAVYKKLNILKINPATFRRKN